MLLLTVAPELKSMERSLSVVEGDTLMIPCEATGRPNPVITWTAALATHADQSQPVRTADFAIAMQSINRRPTRLFRMDTNTNTK